MHGALTSYYFVPSLSNCSTGGLDLYFKITGMCSMLLCLHVEQPVSGSEEEGSQVMQNTESFFILCFVLLQFGAAREHIAITWIKYDVSLEHQMLFKSKF
jgi:hypothetical protein